MRLVRVCAAVLQLTILLAVVLLVLGSVLGQPFVLGYVETGSMSPTLQPGDGFVAVPTQVGSSVDTGDVIVFRAEKLQGGGLTTHRVVGNAERGFITRGDANPFTDQSSGEPPVKRAQIVATALQVNGNVVVIPSLGTAVESVQSVLSTVQRHLTAILGIAALSGTRGLAYLFFAGTFLWYVVGEWRADDTEIPDRTASRITEVDSRLVMGAFAAVLMMGATAAMVAPAGTQEYGVVSAEFSSERPDVIQAGESKSRPYAVRDVPRTRERGRRSPAPGAVRGGGKRRERHGDAARTAGDRLLPAVRDRTPLSRRPPRARDTGALRDTPVGAHRRHRRGDRGPVLPARGAPRRVGPGSTASPPRQTARRSPPPGRAAVVLISLPEPVDGPARERRAGVWASGPHARRPVEPS